MYHRLLADRERPRSLPERYRDRIRQQSDLMELLRRAHQVHAARSVA
ncbi:hypothetical protein [Actinoplanes teichomyceticus]|uniref:Uncharacterized protein n=1 Tax=Actinoplanes teichomyceticus TaxID=1867 RepID=A0A561WP91_ACTTI|nr:hypothetical protein [Actinoplanes teichomyceticus]TWG25668.1 hypothetical protein FHX34_101638 [Actinoplanes teichomyceticus]GIF10741.1 hypothetical protein Ate01nite_07730 [Actinoplanes teichomyceticus]